MAPTAPGGRLVGVIGGKRAAVLGGLHRHLGCAGRVICLTSRVKRHFVCCGSNDFIKCASAAAPRCVSNQRDQDCREQRRRADGAEIRPAFGVRLGHDAAERGAKRPREHERDPEQEHARQLRQVSRAKVTSGIFFIAAEPPLDTTW